MKVKYLIHYLEELNARYGDLEVMVQNHDAHVTMLFDKPELCYLEEFDDQKLYTAEVEYGGDRRGPFIIVKAAMIDLNGRVNGERLVQKNEVEMGSVVDEDPLKVV